MDNVKLSIIPYFSEMWTKSLGQNFNSIKSSMLLNRNGKKKKKKREEERKTLNKFNSMNSHIS